MEKQDFQSPLSITLAPRTGVRFPTAKSGICPRRPTEAWSGGWGAGGGRGRTPALNGV